jgi:hypothetical protein
MSELYWFKFFPKDFMGDMNLKRCSNEAVGVYIKFMCLAFECDESGVFISGSEPWSKEEVICAIGGRYDLTEKAFDELLKWKLIKVREDGAYFNSRMVKDDEERSATRERVRKYRGSNKDVTHDVTDNVTHDVTPHVTESVTHDVTPQILDIRVKNLEVKKEEESERDLNAQAREKPSHSPELKKSGIKDWIKISEDHTGRANNQPRCKSPRDFRPKERNGKPLLEDHEALGILLNDEAYCELLMMNSHVREPAHLKEVAGKWLLYERKKRDEDVSMMTIQEARSGLHLWIKNEKPKTNGSSANKSAAGSENGFDILSARIAKELEGIG